MQIRIGRVRTAAAVMLSLLLASCEAPESQWFVLALWLPDDTPLTIERIRDVRENECRARMLTQGIEQQFQEWRVDSARWQDCLDALARANAVTSPVSMDWLYWTLDDVDSANEDDDAIARLRVRFPDHRALFTHLTGQGLAAARAAGPELHTYSLHGRQFFLLDADGRLITGTLEELALDTLTGRYSLRFALGAAGRGMLTADAVGFSGYFVLGELLYDVGVAGVPGRRIQLISVRPVPSAASHPPDHSAGALFTAADVAVLNEAAFRTYASFQDRALGFNALASRRMPPRCARTYLPPPPGSRSTINVLFAYTKGADLQSSVVIDTSTRGPRKPTPRNWDEFGEHLAFEASKVFSDHQLGTRVQSLGAVELDVSEDFWREKTGNLFGQDDVQLFWHATFLAQEAPPTASADKTVNDELKKLVAGNEELGKGIASLRTLLNETRYAKNADVVAIIASQPSQSADLGGRFCGLGGGIRAQFGNSLLITRVDCAQLNLSFSHELGHLLGARHEGPPSYDCVVGSPKLNRGECLQDDEDYGTAEHPIPNPVPRTNRAYVDPRNKIGTLMTSGAGATGNYEAYLKSDLSFERKPFWSQIDPSVLNGVKLSSGKCCGDGAFADAYAAGCVSQFLPDVVLPPKPPTEDFGRGPADPKPALDIRELEATLEFALNEPRTLDSLTSTQLEKLRRIDEQLLANNIRQFVVEGFADTKGMRAHSLRVSERRALAIAKQLCTGRPDRLIGYNRYGEAGLIITTPDARLELRNRRALISWRPEGQSAYGRSIATQSCADFLSKDLVAFQAQENRRLSASNSR